MKVLVAGVAGFIGSHLARELLRKGHDIIGIDNLSTGRLENIPDGIEFIEHDIRQPLDIDFDVLYHFASPASPSFYSQHRIFTLETISIGTLNLLELAKRKKAHFVLASSSEIYGQPLEHPQSESYLGYVDTLSDRAVYCESKRYAETLTDSFRREGLSTTILRLFNFYGKGMLKGDGRIIPTFVAQALKGNPMTVHGSGEQTRSLLWIDDGIAMITTVAGEKFPGPVNLGSSEEVTVLEIAKRIERKIPESNGLVFKPSIADDPEKRQPDTSLLEEKTGLKPTVDLDHGLDLFIEWARKNY